MKTKIYKKICGKHKINPLQGLLDENVKNILTEDNQKDLEYNKILLDQYFTVYYWEGKYAEV